MPKTAKHKRSHSGCGVLVEYGARYRPAHQTVTDTDKHETAKAYDDKRTETKFHCSAQWKNLRGRSPRQILNFVLDSTKCQCYRVLVTCMTRCEVGICY